MSIIIGSQTYLECDTCYKQSEKNYDQSLAINNAKNKWWYVSDKDGHCQCPECRNKENQKIMGGL
jgi:hypothetical protein